MLFGDRRSVKLGAQYERRNFFVCHMFCQIKKLKTLQQAAGDLPGKVCGLFRFAHIPRSPVRARLPLGANKMRGRRSPAG